MWRDSTGFRFRIWSLQKDPEKRILRLNSWTKYRQKSEEFSSLLFPVTSTALPWELYFFKLTQSLTVSTVQLLYTVKEKGGNLIENHTPSLWFKNPYRNFKSEKSQDYARKPQWNDTFMNLASAQRMKEPLPGIMCNIDLLWKIWRRSSEKTILNFRLWVALHNTRHQLLIIFYMIVLLKLEKWSREINKNDPHTTEGMGSLFKHPCGEQKL